MAMINVDKIKAESKASYNAKYLKDATYNHNAIKVQCWYLDQTGFPRFTDNLLMKKPSVDNAGIITTLGSTQIVFILKAVNNDKAVFVNTSNGGSWECDLEDITTGVSADTKDVPMNSAIAIMNAGSIGSACKVTSLPTSTVGNRLYVVVPTETND